MRVHLLKPKTIKHYAANNPQIRNELSEWLKTLKKCDWDKPDDIFNNFRSADLLGNGTERVVFDIGGNRYRMICKYCFKQTSLRLFVCWIGTHTHYTKLCNEGRQYTIGLY